MLHTDPSQVARAREVFFGAKGLPVDQVNHAILRSWIRCADMGLDARAAPCREAPTASEVRQLHERYEALWRICRSEMDALYNEARDLSGIVVLTNARGEVLDAVGDPGFAGKAAEVALRPGAQWSEDGTGTNAIGTALAERRAVSVNGAEHYFQAHGVLSCAATPIIDPRGAVLGVLDISTPVTVQAGAALGLIRMAVEQIEHRLFRGGFEGCRTLRFQTDANLLGAAREGILAVRDGVIVAANRRGLSLIGQSWDAIDRTRLDEVFELDGGELRPGTARGRDGRDFHLRVDDDGQGAPLLAASAARLDDVELSAIRQALDLHRGNVSAAARQLGIHRSTIYRRLGEIG